MKGTRNKLVIAPLTIPSNICLILILSYTCGKEEAVPQCQYNRLCMRARHFFSRPSTLNFFNIAPLKVVLNHWTDPQKFFKQRILQLSKKCSLKLKLNVPLRMVADAICSDSLSSSDAQDQAEDESSFSQEETLSVLMEKYAKVQALTLNY